MMNLRIAIVLAVAYACSGAPSREAFAAWAFGGGWNHICLADAIFAYGMSLVSGWYPLRKL